MKENTDNGTKEKASRKRLLLVMGASLLALALLITFVAVNIGKKNKAPNGSAGSRTELADNVTGKENSTATVPAASETTGMTEHDTAKNGEGIEQTTDEAQDTTASGETQAPTAGVPEPTAGAPESTAGAPKPTAGTATSAAGAAPSSEVAKPTAGEQKTEAAKPTAGEQKTEAATPAATKAPETQTPSGSVEERARYYISGMTLEEKVAGLFFVHPEVINGGLEANESTREALNRYPVGGIIYFGNNIQSEEQLTRLLAQTKAYSKYPLFLGVDEEGGRVARVAQAFESVENTGDAASLGALNDPKAAYGAYGRIATYLKKYGFNVDFAPVADIYNERNSMFEKRSFGKDAGLVADYVYQAVRGLQDNGISASAKHFPGHGSTKGDSHTGLAVCELTREELISRELLPFKSAVSAGTDFVMMGHISLPNILSDNTPATLSYEIVTGILRRELGYNGIVITDAMRMSAVSSGYSSADASVMAIKAGCDMILMPDNFEEAYNAVLNAVKKGDISVERIEESLMRIYRVKCRNM